MTSEVPLGDRPSLSLFQQPWWLEAAAPGVWSEVAVEEAGKIVARLPFVMKHRQGLRVISMPQLTQTLGPWLAYDSAAPTERLSLEKRLVGLLIDALPPYDVFVQAFHQSVTNWLPFYWKGFQQTTLYTYIVQDMSDLDRVYGSFASGKKGDVKRASRSVEVRQDLGADAFYAHLRSSLKERGETPSYTSEYFRRLHDASLARGQGRTFYAVDARGNVHSCIFIVWDSESAYYLVSSVDPAQRQSGSNSLLIWEAIQFCSTRTRQFNFEGSMIEFVEQSYRRFGGSQTPYMRITGTSRKGKAMMAGLDLVRAVTGRSGS